MNPAGDHVDPYAAPIAVVADPDASPLEATRIAHLRHETSLRSVGWIYALGALLTGSTGVTMLYAVGRLPANSPSEFHTLGPVFLVFAVLAAISAWGFRMLSPWVRWIGGALSVLGLLWIPIGTLFNGYVLYLMFSAKGRRIFTAEYAQIRRQTPHVRFRRSPIEWAGVAVVVGLLALLAAWLALR